MSISSFLSKAITFATHHLVEKLLSSALGIDVDTIGDLLNFNTIRYSDDVLQHGDGSKPKNIQPDRIDLKIGSKVNDVIYGGPGSSHIFAGDGDDIVYGGSGAFSPIDLADYIDGGPGNDTLYGNGGDDVILGGDGNDVIYGGDGNDFILGGYGSDTMVGGSGKDAFVFTSMNDSPHFLRPNNQAPDVITDFRQADHDVIDFSSINAHYGSHADFAFTFLGGNFQNGNISFRAGDLAAYHQGNDFFVQAWDGNTSGPSLLIKLENFSGNLTASDFKL